jgi:hypothetical protein
MTTYIHQQPTPASEWLVNHNLGTKYVNVGVIVFFNNHYESILPKNVISVDESNLRVYFSRPFSGSVRVNN